MKKTVELGDGIGNLDTGVEDWGLELKRMMLKTWILGVMTWRRLKIGAEDLENNIEDLETGSWN